MALYAFDGTWNERKDAGEYDRNTNVVRFVDAYTGRKRLLKGVGTRYGWMGKFLGGAFGVGGKKRIPMARSSRRAWMWSRTGAASSGQTIAFTTP